MDDLEEVKILFQKAGLGFPTIPDELAARLKKRDELLFSTREIQLPPYIIRYYVREIDSIHVEDYASLCYCDNGLNSSALQYYLVYGPLQMFLHMGFGGFYMNNKAAAAHIKKCFMLADEITRAVQSDGKLRALGRLKIVGTDFYGSPWYAPGDNRSTEDWQLFKPPTKVLTEARFWLEELK
jgi:hypothetical protein